jgi:hypothetical protein
MVQDFAHGRDRLCMVKCLVDSRADDRPPQALDPLLLRAQMRVGTTLRSKWRLDLLLGVGGMAIVYAATHRNGSRAAVKILHAELSINAQLRGRFLREGYLANAVGHPGAVKVIDDDIAEDGSLFLVTELLDGETLEDRRIRFGGRLTEDEVVLVADQLLDVLAAAHAKGIIHRDLKPENIFLTHAGQAKVLDFGIARLREMSTISTATKAGATLGTPAYMAPEQARGLWDEVEGRSDLWACGATMFHELSGRWVHEGRTPNEQLLSAMTKPAPPCASAAPRVSHAVAQIVDRALAFERDQRWPDARSMQLAVRQAYRDSHGAAIATAPKLAVPAQVANRTLPSAQGAPAAVDSTTGRPVERGESGGPTAGASAWTPLGVALAIGGAAALGVALTGAVWAVSVGRGNVTAGGASTGMQVVTTLPNPSTMAAAHPAATAPSVEAKDAASEVLPAAGSAFRGASVEQAPPATSAKPALTKTVTGPISSPGPATSTIPPGYRSDVPY